MIVDSRPGAAERKQENTDVVRAAGTIGAQVARAETVLFLGESHTLSFGEHVITRPSAPPLIAQPVFVPNAIALSNITGPEGTLNPNVRMSLRAARLIPETPGEEDGLVSARLEPAWQKFAKRRFSAPPLLVFCLGTYDLFLAIDQFPGDDLVLPEIPFLHPLAPEFRPTNLPGALSVDHGTAWFVPRVKPFQQALRQFRKLGFERLAFLSIPPPTTDDEKALKRAAALGNRLAVPGKLRAAFRYKVALLLNAYVAQICAAENVTFLDAWPILTRDGVAAPDVLEDAAHLSEAAVERVLLELVAPAAANGLPA